MTLRSSESLRSGLHSGAKSKGKRWLRLKQRTPKLSSGSKLTSEACRRGPFGAHGSAVPLAYWNFSFLRASPQTAPNPLSNKTAELGSGTTWTVSIPELKGLPEMYVPGFAKLPNGNM